MKKVVYLVFGIIYLLIAAIPFFSSFLYMSAGFQYILYALIALVPPIILGVCFLLFYSGKKEINKNSDRSLKNGIWALGASIILPIIFFFTGIAFLAKHYPLENEAHAFGAVLSSFAFAGVGLLIGFIWVIISLIFALVAIFKKQ